MIKKIFLTFLLCFFCIDVQADTILLKRGDFKKGMVIEEYADRVVFSTVDGENVIMKVDIEKIQYDDPELNLMSLGDDALNKGRYKLAHKYYTLAVQINPKLTVLREKMDHAGLLAYKEKELTKRELIEKMNMLTSRQEPVIKKTTPEELLENELGIILTRSTDGSFRLDAMKSDSPFRKAGFKLGDNLVSIWSKLTSYLTLKEISDLLLGLDQHTIKTTLERNITMQKEPNTSFAATFAMEWEGMIVKSIEPGSAVEKTGLKIGDLLIAINKEPIRYTKMKDVIDLLNQRDSVVLSMRRTVTVFKVKAK